MNLFLLIWLFRFRPVFYMFLDFITKGTIPWLPMDCASITMVCAVELHIPLRYKKTFGLHDASKSIEHALQGDKTLNTITLNVFLGLAKQHVRTKGAVAFLLKHDRSKHVCATFKSLFS
jgi:hypothetical protein